jgi:hypothetical protein
MILAPSLMNLKTKTPLEVAKAIAKFVSEKVDGVGTPHCTVTYLTNLEKRSLS